MKKHGLSYTTEYRRWAAIRGRCLFQNNKEYKNYGARGITICEEWINSPEQFLKDMGECPDGFCIERIDNNKGYSKENCIWASQFDNARNKRTNHYITYKGKTKILSDWEKEYGFSRGTLFARINSYRWEIEKAFAEPNRNGRDACPKGHIYEKGSFTLQQNKYKRCLICAREKDRIRHRKKVTR